MVGGAEPNVPVQTHIELAGGPIRLPGLHFMLTNPPHTHTHPIAVAVAGTRGMTGGRRGLVPAFYLTAAKQSSIIRRFFKAKSNLASSEEVFRSCTLGSSDAFGLS